MVRDWHKLNGWTVNEAAVQAAGTYCAREHSGRQSGKAVRRDTDCLSAFSKAKCPVMQPTPPPRLALLY